jgi:hypothetical protein
MHVTPRYRGAIIEAVSVHFARLDLPPNPAVEKDVFDRIRWGAGTHFWGTACFKIKGKTKILYVLIFITRGGGFSLEGQGDI